MEKFADVEKTVQILSIDKNENVSGEAYTLKVIVNNYILPQKIS